VVAAGLAAALPVPAVEVLQTDLFPFDVGAAALEGIDQTTVVLPTTAIHNKPVKEVATVAVLVADAAVAMVNNLH
jgi:hypothetical protein